MWGIVSDMKGWRNKGEKFNIKKWKIINCYEHCTGASVSHCLSVGGVEEDGMRTACLGAVVREEVTDRL